VKKKKNTKKKRRLKKQNKKNIKFMLAGALFRTEPRLCFDKRIKSNFIFSALNI
jgi:hypothetical protein